MYDYGQSPSRMPKSVPLVLQPSARERSDGTGPIDRNIPASILLVSESARQTTPHSALRSGVSTYTIESDRSDVHKYCESVR